MPKANSANHKELYENRKLRNLQFAKKIKNRKCP